VVYLDLNRREYKTKYGKEILQSRHIAIRSNQNKIISISKNQGGPNHSALVVSIFNNFLHHYIHPYPDPDHVLYRFHFSPYISAKYRNKTQKEITADLHEYALHPVFSQNPKRLKDHSRQSY
jgi:hypothetical protein